jgi:hypothetical protein
MVSISKLCNPHVDYAHTQPAPQQLLTMKAEPSIISQKNALPIFKPIADLHASADSKASWKSEQSEVLSEPSITDTTAAAKFEAPTSSFDHVLKVNVLSCLVIIVPCY